MRNFFMGCALWGYKDWVGELFPVDSRSADFLKLYGERFTAVEGNTTFYSLPDEKTVARWATETPIGFQFCPKFPRRITHNGVLATKLDETKQFVTRMQGLGDRLGPIFAQLPPSYSPEQWDDLVTFWEKLPHANMEFALEVRHLDWFQPPHAERLAELLTRFNTGRVLLDTRPIYDVPDDPQLHSERKKPRVPLELNITAAFSLIRYISHPEWDVNLPFLEDWVSTVNQWLRQERRVYFFVHCPLEVRSPANARAIQQLLEHHQLPVPPLPWNQLEQPPAQLSLL
ncbi:MAG: DUF72 domain-containing protein [Oscillatoriales cyanobacterium C42_A2020_001]|nr:DUF72 domain-containing protein [Leptolyngbyaceae cyanobacterium C42_A2020_001]